MQARAIPASVSIRKLLNKILNVYSNRNKRKEVFSNQTYKEAPDWFNYIHHSVFLLPKLELLKSSENHIFEIAEHYLSHRFNLLGSGWTEIFIGAQAEGFEGYKFQPIDFRLLKPDKKLSRQWISLNATPANKEYSLEVNKLISDDYRLLDWQVDFRSGYRWSSLDWQKDVKYGNIPGADIKIPWELGRMQYLPSLALAYSISKTRNGTFSQPDVYLNEFKNIVLDFIAQNPPEFGAQWMTAMDASIRAVNQLVAFDFFNQANASFEESFLTKFRDNIYSHIEFIVNNLEWSSGMRGNHFLANIAGLTIVLSYLPQNDVVVEWLAFVMNLLFGEIDYQFYKDGGNFEASTSYHLFGTELVVFALEALSNLKPQQIEKLGNFEKDNKKISSIKKPKNAIQFKFYSIDKQIELSKKIKERLSAMFNFSNAITLPTRHSLNIGDNDSGSMIRFIPCLHEDGLNVNNNSKSLNQTYFNSIIDNVNTFFKIGINSIQESCCNCAFPDFGLYLFRHSDYLLSVRCGSLGQRGKGGHAHNDQLSITLSFPEGEFIVDAGCFAYTSLPEVRNLYRSTQMHNVIFPQNIEQNEWLTGTKDDLFWLFERTKSVVKKFDKSGFAGEHYGYGKPCIREIYIKGKNELVFTDKLLFECKKNARLFFHPNVRIESNSVNEVRCKLEQRTIIIVHNSAEAREFNYNYSPDYGVKIPSKAIEFSLPNTSFNWRILF